jgi:hypothetical protein
VGEEFKTKKGLPFSYAIVHGTLRTSRNKGEIPKADFEQALARVPLKNPSAVFDLHGASILYAVLMDDRIRADNW